MRISLFFELEKVLLFLYFLSKLGYESEIWYVHLVSVPDVPFVGLDFSPPFHPLMALKEVFFLTGFSYDLSLFLA